MNWRHPTRLYYPRATPPDIALEERDAVFKQFNANIYVWNIDGKSETAIMETL